MHFCKHLFIPRSFPESNLKEQLGGDCIARSHLSGGNERVTNTALSPPIGILLVHGSNQKLSDHISSSLASRPPLPLIASFFPKPSITSHGLCIM